MLAHGVGGSTDLPVPLSFALIGAAWALTATFAIVALAWKTPRFDPTNPGRELPMWVTRTVDSAAMRWTAAIAALLFTIWAAAASVWGPADSDNALPGVFYVLLWVGLVAMSVCVGPLWRIISPVRTIYRLGAMARGRSRGSPSERSYPLSLGVLAGGVGIVRVRLAGTSQL